MNIPLLSKPSWLTRLGLGLASGLAIVASLAIASLLFTVLLVAGLVLGSWMWWQYRRLLRQARNAARPDFPDFIEGEYRVETDRPALEDRRPTPAGSTDDPVILTQRQNP